MGEKGRPESGISIQDRRVCFDVDVAHDTPAMQAAEAAVPFENDRTPIRRLPGYKMLRSFSLTFVTASMPLPGGEGRPAAAIMGWPINSTEEYAQITDREYRFQNMKDQ